MAKFCVYCGAPLEETNGRCPLCEREQPDLSEPKPMVWPTVKGEKPQEQTEQEAFPHAQEWLSQESPVWQEETQDKQTPEREKSHEKAPQEKVQQEAASVEEGENQKREEETPDAESASVKQAGNEVVRENDFGAEHETSRQASDKAKQTTEHQAMQQPESDEARQREYETTFSEMLQDFSEEQKQNSQPPQPKYLPAATYEEQPQPTTAGILGTLVLSMIPIVGWILLLVWAFDGQAAVLQKKLARALLLFKLIVWLILLIAGGLTFYISYEIIQMSAYSAFAFSGMP